MEKQNSTWICFQIYEKLNSTEFVENVLSINYIKTPVENNFPQNRIPLLCRWINWNVHFHDFWGKINSTELMENKFSVEFGFPEVDDFTLNKIILPRKNSWNL